MLKRLAVLLFFALTACSVVDSFIPELPSLPPTIVVLTQAPSQTAVPSETPLPSLAPTSALLPTGTLPPTEAPTLVTETPKLPTSTITATPGSPSYRVQPGTPVLTQNFAHLTEGCQWLSVAGQVFDAAGNEVLNIVVRVTGTLNGNPVDKISLTGTVTEYGPSGYEIKLADQAISSNATLIIQLMDLQAQPLSNPLPFNTSSDCSQNVTLINFTP
jgi:hypothetical protein